MAMERALETFLTALYVIVDDLSQSHMRLQLPAWGGPPALMSDSEVLCLGLAAQWRSGVPWKSERGILRDGRQQLRHLFPSVRTQRAFHCRLRRLWGAFMLIQDAMAGQLAQGASDVMDGFPLPMAPGARSFNPGWLADIARRGTGGHDRYFYGVRMRMVLKQNGGATGGALAAGHGQERWVAAWLFSTRAGVPGVHGPRDETGQKPQVTPPEEWRAVVPSAGAASTKPSLSDGGFRGDDWLAPWAKASGAQVYPRSKAAPRAERRWLRSATTFANLTESFGLKYPGAHSTWGLLMRVVAKGAA
jgi:hypothetical protein